MWMNANSKLSVTVCVLLNDKKTPSYLRNTAGARVSSLWLLQVFTAKEIVCYVNDRVAYFRAFCDTKYNKKNKKTSQI